MKLRNRTKTPWGGLVAVGLTLVVSSGTVQGKEWIEGQAEDGAAQSSANRRLPATFRAETTISVCIDLGAAPDTLAVGIEDAPPAGWVVSDIDHGGVWDATNLKVKWGPFFAPLPASICYLARAFDGVEGSQCFRGVASFDGINAAIGGDQCTQPAECPFLVSPDGSNDCDQNGVADECDPDDDGDTVPDECDNCSGTPNPDQADFDEDGAGDLCDPDIDDDGIGNGQDVCDFTPLELPREFIEISGAVRGDLDADCDVDLRDHAIMQVRFTGPN